jgi:hypothetical protein
MMLPMGNKRKHVVPTPSPVKTDPARSQVCVRVVSRW